MGPNWKQNKVSGLEDRCIGVRFPEVVLGCFLFATLSRRTQDPTQSLVCWAPRTLYPDIKLSEHTANEKTYTSIHLHVILVWQSRAWHFHWMIYTTCYSNIDYQTVSDNSEYVEVLYPACTKCYDPYQTLRCQAIRPHYESFPLWEPHTV